MWHPYAAETLRALADDGVDEVAVLPLAQFSAPLYVETVREAAKALADEGKPTVRIEGADNWGLVPALLDAFARRVREALSAVAPADLPHTMLVLSAHSLPVAIVRAGDPYEREFRESAEGVRTRLGADAPDTRICFQSQGMSKGPGGRPVEWLGPTLEATIDEAARAGKRHVVVAPMGFLADHVEILYDLDIEADRMARERGLVLSRTRSLNADADFVDVLASMAQPLLARFDGRSL
jgi:ferrochelatase